MIFVYLCLYIKKIKLNTFNLKTKSSISINVKLIPSDKSIRRNNILNDHRRMISQFKLKTNFFSLFFLFSNTILCKIVCFNELLVLVFVFVVMGL